MNSLIQAHNLSVHRAGQQILNQVDLSLEPAQIVSLIGPNGAGKTTLIKAMLGLIKPTHGKVSRQRDLRIGYMPQKLHIDPNLPISCERFLRLVVNETRDIERALAITAISHLRKHPLQALSGGELQRLLLARALVRRPQLLVLDEPAQGVDISGQSELYALIGQLRDRYRCAVLMVSHDLHLVMAATDRVVCLNQHICCQGEPDQVSDDPAYLALFGRRQSETLAVYHHHHNHEHDIHGDIIDSHSQCEGKHP